MSTINFIIGYLLSSHLRGSHQATYIFTRYRTPIITSLWSSSLSYLAVITLTDTHHIITTPSSHQSYTHYRIIQTRISYISSHSSHHMPLIHHTYCTQSGHHTLDITNVSYHIIVSQSSSHMQSSRCLTQSVSSHLIIA